jgi:hemerythrin superfamily protein
LERFLHWLGAGPPNHRGKEEMSIQQTIYDVLQKDHRRLSVLFEQLKKTRDWRTRDLVFERVATELTAHGEAEAVTLYTVLKTYGEMGADVEQGEQQHDRIAELLQELENERGNLAAWERKLDELRRAVERHVEEEEEEIFLEAQSVLDDEQARLLARRFLEEKTRRLG